LKISPSLANDDNGTARPAKDRAYFTILHNILDGKYCAGERLTESRLTAELSLSRISVREALIRLAHEGAIDLHRHRGASLRVLTRKDIAEFFDVRSMFESRSAAAAAGRIGEKCCDAQRHRLVDHLVKLRKWAGGTTVCDTEEFAEHNQQFHQSVIELGGNQLLVKFWNGLQLPQQRLRFIQPYGLSDLETSIVEHLRIVEAILAGDALSAESYTRSHTNHVAARLYALSDREFNLIFNPGIGGPLGPDFS